MKIQKQKSLFTPLFAAIAAIGVAASATSATAQNYDFKLVGGDASGSSSFNSIGNWQTNTGVKAAFAPSAGYVYLVEGNSNQLRSPNGSAAATFQGTQLILGEEGNINWKGANNGSITITNLVFRGGRIAHGQDNMTGTLRGGYDIPGGETGIIRINDNNPRTFNLEAAFTGAGTLWLDVRNIGGSGENKINVSGDNSAFTGPVIMEGQNGGGKIVIADEINIGAAPAEFTPDHVTLNGMTLALGNAQLVAPTRGLLIGSRNATLEVGAGESAFIGGAISGAGTLTKTGAGLLILDSTNSYSGATTISAGTLAFNSTNDHSAVAVQAAGAIGGTGAVNTAVTFANGASIALAGNGFGALALNSPSGVSLNNAKLSFDLRSPTDGASDSLEIAGALTLSGSSTIAFAMPPDGLASGDYELVTFASKAGAGSIALNMNYPNTQLLVTSSNIVFKVNSGLYNVALESLPAEKPGATSIVLPAAVTEVPSIGGALRVYYGETDGVETPSAWTGGYVDYGAANEAGTYKIYVDGFELGKTYHYRHAYVVNGTDIFFAPASLSFQPIDDDVPTEFAWLDSVFPVIWSDSKWLNMSGYAREMPGFPGDTLNTQTLPRYNNAIYTLTNDLTVGHIRAGFNTNDDEGYLRFYSAAEDGPATLTLDPGATSPTSDVLMQRLRRIDFGEANAARHDNLRLHLAAPFNFRKYNTGSSTLFFHAPISGGDAASPTHLYLNLDGNEWVGLRVLFSNTNSFVGDIYAGTKNNKSITINLGFTEEGVAFNCTADDRMLGDPQNRVILRNNSRMIFHNTAGFAFTRHLLGTGNLRCCNFNRWYVGGDDWPTALTFTDTTLLSPGEDDAFGSLSFWASAVNFSPDTAIKIKVSPAGSDKLVFEARGNSTNNGSANNNAIGVTPGTVNLNNARVELIPVLAPNERLNFGDRWEIASCANTNTIVNGALTSGTQYFRLSAEPATATTGYKIFATYLYSGTMLIVR